MDELLNGEIFYTLREAQILIENWRLDSSFFGFSEDVFEFCKDLFDGIEIGLYGGKNNCIAARITV